MSYDVNADGHLVIGGCDAVKLAGKYGTPLVVYDVTKIKSQIENFQKVFREENVKSAVCYASKAFANTAIYQLVKEEGCHIDVVSGGELYMALNAGFPADRISFHGNNKSYDELTMAVKHHVGMIMLDNFHEIDLLNQVLEEQDANTDVMLRITPGISAHTHEYIQTGQVDSKFGFDYESGAAEEAFRIVNSNSRMTMQGIHAHIGSQIFELAGFDMVADKLVSIADEWKQKYDYQTNIINVGGGFGIRYTKEDHPLAPEEFVASIVEKIKNKINEKHLTMPAIWIEPGRSIVGPAGYNLYTIGSRKDVDGIESYVSVDGGMGDNIRPALYQAEYEAAVANHPNAPTVENARIAGKYCESGDILIQDQALPETHPGDILVMFATGAYGYSMASNYNLNPKPAIVFVENGKSQLVTKRETYQDLVNLDEPLNLN